jgi:hypothetical protein
MKNNLYISEETCYGQNKEEAEKGMNDKILSRAHRKATDFGIPILIELFPSSGYFYPEKGGYRCITVLVLS